MMYQFSMTAARMCAVQISTFSIVSKSAQRRSEPSQRVGGWDLFLHRGWVPQPFEFLNVKWSARAHVADHSGRCQRQQNSGSP